ncbi:potassium transporter 7-like [Canna indica]|uniref:Potassium transporter n=1 Tax=Canna indica TaxID=4628 RepID=A0AAQ3QBP6_9LILI|nr:potassium transporter 7-like [Canna indica]
MAVASRRNGHRIDIGSTESRWVAPDDEENSSEEGEDWSQGMSLDSEEEDDSEEQMLIRTSPQIDSLDVEALEIAEAKKDEFEDVSLTRHVVLTLQILGVVFGDVGTSPLYTFDVMFNKYPLTEKEDVLGALSLILYTLILIPLVKYTFVVFWANNDGQGGTFALYSLICRKSKAGLLPNQFPPDNHLSSFGLKVPSTELERSLKLKEYLENSLRIKWLLLMLVIFGTSMVIADGIVTPAISVMSAFNGLKVGMSGVEQGEVVMISVASLIILFSVQRFNTSKVGLAVGPALFIWFFSLGIIGIFNLSKYGIDVLKAFSPFYIYNFFKRNLSQAWMSLGGCLLCATGSEAMFADLCYFSVRSVQLTFVFLVLPCLVLGYLGQAAFLMENLTETEQVFFSSIPSGAFWPVFLIATIAALIASRAMITAIFSCLKQAIALGCFPRIKVIHTSRKFMGQIYIPVVNWFLLVSCVAFVATFGSIYEIGNAYGIAELGVMIMTTVLVTIVMILIWQTNIVLVLCFSTSFLGLELIFFSSVLGGVVDGSWVMLVFAALLFMIMYIWNYGRKLKYETEEKQKLSMDLMMELGCNLGTIRAPGIGLVYNELAKGIPGIFGHFLTTLPAVHSMIIFVCIKYVPVPVVPQTERFLFRRVCPKSYHMFRCIARYGYKDVRKEHHQVFQQLLIESLEKFIRREAHERSLESDEDAKRTYEKDVPSNILESPNGGMYSLSTPLLAGYNAIAQTHSEASTSFGEPRNKAVIYELQNLEPELSFIRKAKESGVVYLLGHGDIRARKDSWFIKKLVINYFYAFLRRNCRKSIASLSVPHTNLIQVGMTYMV